MSRDYVDGFNNGYVIAERLPGLAKQLSHPSLEAPWFEGFRDGRDQFVRDQAKEMRPDWLQGDRGTPEQPEPGNAPEKDSGHKDNVVPFPSKDQDHER